MTTTNRRASSARIPHPFFGPFAVAVLAVLSIQAETVKLPAGSSTRAGVKTAIAQSKASPAAGANKNWLAEAMANIEDSEYEIRWQPAANAWQSPNRAQNLRFTYWDDGFAAEPRTAAEPNSHWKVKIALQSYGRTQETAPLGQPAWKVSGKRASATTRGLAFEYTNDRDGMRQNFVLAEKPKGQGPLRLNFRAELRSVCMTIHPDRAVVSFVRDEAGGAEVMRYSDLKVWDAARRPLAASFEARGGNHFAILVDDSAAKYPIVIDPLSTSVARSWEGEQTSAWFGSSVASAGDVNGDGYSDVIVGASQYDNGSTDEGKVFVYHGSSTGLPTTADWTAEPDWAYSNMGNSVASAGDVNGDGYSDIIVGATRYTGGGNEGAPSSGSAVQAAWVQTEPPATPTGTCTAASHTINSVTRSLPPEMSMGTATAISSWRLRTTATTTRRMGSFTFSTALQPGLPPPRTRPTTAIRITPILDMGSQPRGT